MLMMAELYPDIVKMPLDSESIIMELRERWRPIFARHGVQQAILFGSVARGRASRRSDLDLIVILETELRFLDRYRELLPELTAAVPERDLDLLIYTRQELTSIAHRPFIAAALREGRVIYEPGKKPPGSRPLVADRG